jgi:hypothetical protein
MLKKFLIISLFAGLAACASSNQPQELSQLPSWYITPKSFDNQNLYGVGEGYTLAEASQSALNNLSAKLMTSISSESSLLMESNRYGVNEQSRQNINESVAKVTFNNYQVSNSAGFSGKIYTEVTVGRDNFVKDNQQTLTDLNQKMANLYAGLQGKTILERYNDLNSINNLIPDARNITAILSSLNAANVNLKANIDLYNTYQNAYQNLASKMEFVVEPGNTPAPVVKAVVKFLNQQNFKVVKTKNLANSDLIILQISSELTEQKIYGSNIAKLTLNFNLLSNQNKIIKSTSLEASGSSVISKAEAVNAAVAGMSITNLFE